MNPSVSEPVPPELVDHPQYEVLRELGRGGMGIVYLARHRLSGREEVLKVMNHESLDRAGSKERFLREIQAAARLDHPHVVHMYTALEAGKLLVLVMEYVEGQQLAKLVQANGPLSVVLACYYAQQAALGLQHAFEKGMVHRDIKPHNLILSRQRKRHVVKVLDFGLAKARGESGFSRELTAEGKLLGTPDYIAPEQALDAATADIRADIYSLGCTLYFMLAGTPPFEAKSFFELLLAHQSRESRPLHQVRSDVPAELAAVVRKMMAKDPAQRYQTPAEVAQALAPFVRGQQKTSLGAAAATKRAGARPRSVVTAQAAQSPVRWETLVDSSPTPAPGSAAAALQQRRMAKRRWRLRLSILLGVGGPAAIVVALLAIWVGGLLHGKPRGDTPGMLADSSGDGQESEPEFVLADRQARLALGFHDKGDNITGGPSMRFGLVMPREPDPADPSRRKRLTYDVLGRSNNTVLRIDGDDRLFGENAPAQFPGAPGRWDGMAQPLEQNRPWQREGARSTWVYDESKLAISQVVEVVPGEQSHLLDTCLVRYRIENRDSKAHRLGLRFLLDTFIGSNDGVPFLIPGSPALCDSKHQFDSADDVPDFVQALEHEDLTKPGTVAQVQFRLGGGIDAPDRVTLGAWPDKNLTRYYPNLRGRLRQQLSGWDVPVLPMKTMRPPDSAVVIYWNERALAPGATREVGFLYGLSDLASAEGQGKLALTVGGPFLPGGTFTLTAYVRNPQAGQKVALTVPPGFEIVAGGTDQAVPLPPAGTASPNSPVTWRIRAGRRPGRHTLGVQLSSGEAQHVTVTVRSKSIFD